MDMDLISIIIPCYNASKTIEKCVSTLFLQSYTNIEILAIDDGSTDNTNEVLNKLAESDPRLIVLTQENKGVSCARNKGIEISKGKYISFVDADDHVDVNYIKRMHDILIREKTQLVISKYLIGDDNPKDNANLDISDKKSLIKEMMIPKHNIGSFVFNRLYVREIITSNSITFDPDIYVCEDILFNYEYLKHAESFSICDEYLYFYVINPQGTMFSDGFNLKKLSANKAFTRMLKSCDNEVKKPIEISAMLYNLIVKRQIYKNHINVDSDDLKTINHMLKMNPMGFLKADIALKYKVAYPFWLFR